ncbi:hypothetical protein IV203_017649 [Nitzschia inconspicua]|uniref:Uncharacterized protein n=1 Tax=Nitzschia inconspicua TaxID=303405 RepID=A0A9K3P9B7_9STRA|nr:hypothetical protein IV203_017649 [Nitzschia inconspicua]
MFLSDYMMESKSVDDPGRDSRPRAFGVSSVAMDGSVTRCSTSGDETSTHSDDKYAFLTCRDGGKSVMILKNDDTGKRRAQTLVTIFIALIVATLFFLMVFFTTRKVQENGTSSSASSHSELCPLVVDDTREPQLEIYFTGLSKEPTDEEKEQLKRAIMKGYNEAVGGCRDHFKRWMYQVDLVNAEAQDEIIIMTESSTDLQNRFDDVSAFVARFRTKISCDGCPHEEAFASVYPPVFGSNIVPPGNRRRTSDELNAADIVLAIEREVHDTMPDFDSFLEFSVLTQEKMGRRYPLPS